MMLVHNGYACKHCKTIFSSLEDVKQCESTPIEESLLSLGDILLEEDATIQLEKVYYHMHMVCYEFRNAESGECYSTVYGNETLQERFKTHFYKRKKNLA